MKENYIPSKEEIKKVRNEIDEKKNDPVLAYYFYRKISFFVSSKILVKFPITANQITVFNFFLCLFAAVLIFSEKEFFLIFSGILIQLVIILDGVDGEIAKMKKCQSKFGGWLDGNTDIVKYIFLCVSLGFTLYQQTGGILPFILLTTLISTRFVSFAMAYSAEKIFSGSIHDITKVSNKTNRLSKVLGLRPEFLNFSDDIKFCLISLGVIFNKILFTMVALSLGQCIVIFVCFFGMLKNRELEKNKFTFVEKLNEKR